MKRIKWSLPLGLLAAVTVALVVSTGASQPQPAPKKSIFSTLKVGQSVSLKEKASGWEVSTTDDVAPLTHQIAEIKDDYIVLLDEAGSVETRIPVTAVRAVIHVKTKRK